MEARMRGVFVLVTLALAGAALAQTGDVQSVCAAMTTEAERNACMRGAEAALSVSSAQSQAGSQAPAREGGGFPGPGVFDGERGSSAADGLGAETLAPVASDAGRERVRANIVAFREHAPGILEFELDNGQVWRQTSGASPEDHLSTRDPEPVEMWLSWAGGYRMRLVNHRQTIRVQRLR